MSILTLRPQAETRGEGNGWYDVADAQATLWAVEDEHAVVDVFDNRAAALNFIQES